MVFLLSSPTQFLGVRTPPLHPPNFPNHQALRNSNVRSGSTTPSGGCFLRKVYQSTSETRSFARPRLSDSWEKTNAKIKRAVTGERNSLHTLRYCATSGANQALLPTCITTNSSSYCNLKQPLPLHKSRRSFIMTFPMEVIISLRRKRDTINIYWKIKLFW